MTYEAKRAVYLPVRECLQLEFLLPEGTALRTSYCSTIEFAKVVGDQVVANDGVMLTPSQFANRHAKGRNAWHFVWLRFPRSDQWVRAGTCRMRHHERQSNQSKSAIELPNSVYP